MALEPELVKVDYLATVDVAASTCVAKANGHNILLSKATMAILLTMVANLRKVRAVEICSQLHGLMWP